MSRPILLIPARGGSKGVIRKNLQTVGGVTLVQRAILASIDSELGEVWVSTDDQEIKELAKKAGARVADRSQSCASDNATADDVVREFLAWYVGQTSIIYVQPTSPLRSSRHLRDAWDLHLKSNFEPVVSVRLVSQHPGKMVRLVNHKLAPVSENHDLTSNRQSLEPLFIPNGAVYVFKSSDFKSSDCIPIHGALPLIMPEKDSLDIDSTFDLEIANLLSSDDKGEK